MDTHFLSIDILIVNLNHNVMQIPKRVWFIRHIACIDPYTNTVSVTLNVPHEFLHLQSDSPKYFGFYSLERRGKSIVIKRTFNTKLYGPSCDLSWMIYEEIRLMRIKIIETKIDILNLKLHGLERE